jgi:PilZ domain
MATTEALVRDQQDLILRESISEQRHLVLTHNGPLGWRTFKASFASERQSSGEFTVRVLVTKDMEPTDLPQKGDTLGGTFRMGHKKCMFCTELVSARCGEGEATFVVTWPAQVQQLRRRAYERATPPGDQVVAVRFWCESDSSQSAADARTVRHGQLEDLSCGGIRLKVSNVSDLKMEATYKCVFSPRQGKPAVLVDGILRHREAVEHGRASLGFQFVGLETTPEGMKTLDRLARIVNHFQRSKSRRVPREGWQK